jgi:hypothetical protein
MAANYVDISGIDKVTLLYALWSNVSPAIFYDMKFIVPPSFDRSRAARAVQQYIDYYDGRCIKTDLSGNSVNPYLYDRDAGQGAFARVVAGLRK